MKNLTTFSEVQAQFQIKDFVEKTVLQINKDLNGLMVDPLKVDFEKSSWNLIELVNECMAMLKKLSENNQLQQYIYQVDLIEKKWIEFLTNKNFKVLAEQIIIREAQKVYLRERFKQ